MRHSQNSGSVPQLECDRKHVYLRPVSLWEEQDSSIWNNLQKPLWMFLTLACPSIFLAYKNRNAKIELFSKKFQKIGTRPDTSFTIPSPELKNLLAVYIKEIFKTTCTSPGIIFSGCYCCVEQVKLMLLTAKHVKCLKNWKISEQKHIGTSSSSSWWIRGFDWCNSPVFPIESRLQGEYFGILYHWDNINIQCVLYTILMLKEKSV